MLNYSSSTSKAELIEINLSQILEEIKIEVPILSKNS